MRILFTIAHYYGQTENGFYGSLASPAKKRLQVLVNCVAALRQHFGPKQGLTFSTERRITGANRGRDQKIEIVVCTDGDNHLLDHLPNGLVRKRDVAGDPMLLGYGCHEVLAAEIDNYDYFCFLEDDIIINDPEFFQKLNWFETVANEESILQPNRFETLIGQPVDKLYIDGNLGKPQFSAQFQDITIDTNLSASHLGGQLNFQRVNNPHSGCFFLNQRQMRQWMDQPYFLDRSVDFCGPLESAATLGIMKTFKIYKPARENASFLEVRHGDNRYLGNRMRIPQNWQPD